VERKVLTEEEINVLKVLNDRNIKIVNTLGRIEYQLTLLEEEKQKVKSEVAQIESESRVLGTQLNEKYGNGTIDLEAGEIILD
jgi:hypothetical protein